MIKKCETGYKETCKKRAKFKIVDFECGNEYGDYVSFWVCKDCIGFFISENEDDPHYILLEEISQSKGEKVYDEYLKERSL